MFEGIFDLQALFLNMATTGGVAECLKLCEQTYLEMDMVQMKSSNTWEGFRRQNLPKVSNDWQKPTQLVIKNTGEKTKLILCEDT